MMAMEVLSNRHLLDEILQYQNGVPIYIYEFQKKYHCKSHTEMMIAAFRHSEWTIANWFYEREFDTNWLKIFYSYSAFSSSIFCHQDKLKWMLQHIKSNECTWIWDHYLERVLQSHKVDLMQLILIQRGQYITRKLDFWHYSADNGYLQAMEILYPYCMDIPRREMGYAMRDAVVNGNLQVIQFLQERGLGECRAGDLDQAASRGYLETIQYMYTNRTERCSPQGIVSAAENGHLDVVKFLCKQFVLDDIREDLCAAINKATANGHLSVLQYLQEITSLCN